MPVAKFVIHKHAATRLHFDLRLEMDGVLKSWAVPKEPPNTPGQRRLAIAVEDHPLSYIDFQGIIPEGEYGAGTVEIWDRGTYTLVDRTQKKIEFALHGERLQGAFILLNMRANQWLLFKRRAET